MRLKSRMIRRERQLKHFWHRFAVFLTPLFFVGLVSFGYFSPWFRVESVFCRAENGSCEPLIWTGVLAKYKNRPLWLVGQGETEGAILELFDDVEAVELLKRWPRTIELRIILRQPLFEICKTSMPANVGDSFVPPIKPECLVLSEDGRRLPRRSDVRLARFYLDQFDDEKTGRLWRLVSELKRENFTFQEGWIIADQPIVAVVIGGRKVIFSLEKEIEIQVDSLQSILAQAKMEDRPVSEIDFRFDKPVVWFVNT